MWVFIPKIVWPSTNSSYTNDEGVEIIVVSDRETSSSSGFTRVWIEVTDVCPSPAVPPIHLIPVVMPRSSRRYKNQHAFSMQALKVPNSHQHKGR